MLVRWGLRLSNIQGSDMEPVVEWAVHFGIILCSTELPKLLPTFPNFPSARSGQLLGTMEATY